MLVITTATFLSILFEYYIKCGRTKRDTSFKEPRADISGFGSWYARKINTKQRSMIFHGVEYMIISLVFIGMTVVLIPSMPLEIIAILSILAVLITTLGAASGYVSFKNARRQS